MFVYASQSPYAASFTPLQKLDSALPNMNTVGEVLSYAMTQNDHEFSFKLGELRVADELPYGSDACIVMVPHLELVGSSTMASHAAVIDFAALVNRNEKRATAPREAKAGAVRVGAADTDRLVAENPWLAPYLGRDGHNRTDGAARQGETGGLWSRCGG